MSTSGTAEEVEVGGRRVRVTTLERVLFPETATTRADGLGYYARIAPGLMPHLPRWRGSPPRSSSFTPTGKRAPLASSAPSRSRR
jgi:DNA primase